MYTEFANITETLIGITVSSTEGHNYQNVLYVFRLWFVKKGLHNKLKKNQNQIIWTDDTFAWACAEQTCFHRSRMQEM